MRTNIILITLFIILSVIWIPTILIYIGVKIGIKIGESIFDDLYN
jgi:hypothetical protein